jgi:tartrate-resistant acid phosphatase type 5
MMRKLFIAGIILAFIMVECTKMDLIDSVGYSLAVESDSITFAIIGDFGDGDQDEAMVAEMVKSWQPDFIITTGDNNYEEGKLNTISENISNFYSDYIYNYDAPVQYQCKGMAYETGVNRFFPTPGNHDANNNDGLIPYYNYFTLPECERFYKFSWGPVTFFSINSVNENIPEQEVWLERQMITSVTPFNIVYSHVPPYSEGPHGNHEEMQLNFYAHGIDAVISGHDHIYSKIEKLSEPGLFYLINGLGGKNRHAIHVNPLPPEEFSVFSYNADFGAIKATASQNRLILQFYSVNLQSEPIDVITIEK